MKKLFTVVLLIGFGMAWAACASRRQADKIKPESKASVNIAVQTFTQRDLYPGMPSNLIKTRMYRVVMNGEFSPSIRIEGLRLDSVLLRTYDLTASGENSRGASVLLSDSVARIDVSFSRWVLETYDDEHAMAYMQWQDSTLPEGVYKLVFVTEDGQVLEKRIDAPEVLEPLHAP